MFKKILFTLMLPLTLTFKSHGEFHPCATEYPEEMYLWLKDYVQNTPNLTHKRPDEKIMLPLQIHLVANDAGEGFYSSRTLMTVLCELNDHFDETGFYFYLHDDVNYIRSTSLYIHSSSFAIAPLINATRRPDAINMYFVQNPAGACGYYSGGATSQGALEEGGLDFMMINQSNNCAGPGNITIAHEVGHYFSLPHPFFRWEGGNVPDNPEYVTRDPELRNCHETADLFCDTEADYFYERWSAPYNFNNNPFGFELIDPLGDQISPDASLFMSYANEPAPNRFSEEQMNAMNGFLFARRGNLLQHEAPEVVSIDQAPSLVTPVAGSTLPSHYVDLKWSNVPNATHYSVQVAINSGFTNMRFDTIVADTSVVVRNLQPTSNFFWRVTPLNRAYYCAPVSETRAFSTGNVQTSNGEQIFINPNLVTRFCAGDSQGSIFLDPEGGIEPYQFIWSGGFTGSSVTGVAPGKYDVTIVDDEGNSLPLNIDLFPYELLEAEIVVGPSLLSAEVSGGKAPYSFEWSNGFQDAKIFELDPGNYDVTITDATGCTLQKSAVLTGIADQDIANFRNLRVYPNPTSSNGHIHMSFESKENSDGKFQLFNNQGQLVIERELDINAGINTQTIHFSHLPEGVYFMRLTANGEFVNRRIVVL